MGDQVPHQGCGSQAGQGQTHEVGGRALDPQLHTHAGVMNVVMREDGTTGTLDLGHFYRQQKIIAGIYHKTLADTLARELKVDIKINEKTGVFDLKAIPDDLLATFSKRAEAIEVAAKGLTKAQRDVAALATRDNKILLPENQHREAWREEALAAGHPAEEVIATCGTGDIRKFADPVEKALGPCSTGGKGNQKKIPQVVGSRSAPY